jgi:hypothetical protein
MPDSSILKVEALSSSICKLLFDCAITFQVIILMLKLERHLFHKNNAIAYQTPLVLVLQLYPYFTIQYPKSLTDEHLKI